MTKRTLEDLVRTVREELRLPGPDGGGIPDPLIEDALNEAHQDLSDIFTIRDTVEITTEAEQNTYDLLDSNVTSVEIYDIIAVQYDGDDLTGETPHAYLKRTIKDSGTVRHFTYWGTSLILIGEVEGNKTVTLWVNRAPRRLVDSDDVLELPTYTESAVVQYVMSTCYRHLKDYDRASFHYRAYANQKSNISGRSIPQGQRDHQPTMSDSYWGPVDGQFGVSRTDTNPGGIIINE